MYLPLVMKSKHATLWIDHHEARLVHLADDGPSYETVAVHGPHGPTHDRRHDGGHRHTLDRAYADRVAAALGEVEEILVVGPSTAKDELMKELAAHHPAITKRVLGVEASEHASDGQLADRARRFFFAADRLRGVHVR